MSQELHYTSAPRGLKPGSRGFCTVACTAGLPGPLAERLESLSGYQQVFPPHDPDAARNPVVWSHLRLNLAGKAPSVLSRIGSAGLDYTERANKYAHHIALEPNERPAGGPAWLLRQPGFLQSAWDGEPRLLPAGRRSPQGDTPPAVAQAWQAQTGDAGWAGVLAESFLADPRRLIYLVFEAGMDLLPLFAEAIALLPPNRRWDVTFSTYFTHLPQGIPCAWRGVLRGSDAAKQARRFPDALVLDLTGPMGRADGGELVQCARTGELPTAAVPPELSPPLGEGAVGVEAVSNREVPEPNLASPPSLTEYALIPPLNAVDSVIKFDHGRSPKSKPRARRRLTLAAALTVAVLALMAGLVWKLGIGSSQPDRRVSNAKSPTRPDKPSHGRTVAKKSSSSATSVANSTGHIGEETIKSNPTVESGDLAPKQPADRGSDAHLELTDNLPQPGSSPSSDSTGKEEILYLELPKLDASLLRNERDDLKREQPLEVTPDRVELLGLDASLRAETKQGSMVVSVPKKSQLEKVQEVGCFSVIESNLQFSWDEKMRTAYNRTALVQALERAILVVSTPDGKIAHYFLKRVPGDVACPLSIATDLNSPDEQTPLRKKILLWDESADCSTFAENLKIKKLKIVSKLANKPDYTLLEACPESRSQKAELLPERITVYVEFVEATDDLEIRLDVKNSKIKDIAQSNDKKLKEITSELEKLKQAAPDSTNEESSKSKLEQQKAELERTIKHDSEIVEAVQQCKASDMSIIISVKIGGIELDVARFGDFARTRSR